MSQQVLLNIAVSRRRSLDKLNKAEYAVLQDMRRMFPDHKVIDTVATTMNLNQQYLEVTVVAEPGYETLNITSISVADNKLFEQYYLQGKIDVVVHYILADGSIRPRG